MSELEQGKDGKYYWNLIAGKTYWLGYHCENGGHSWNAESIDARYFGSINGMRVFFREDKKGRILRYASHSDAPAAWHSDGEDEPSIPSVMASFEGELPDGREKDYVRGILEADKKKTLEELAKQQLKQ